MSDKQQYSTPDGSVWVQSINPVDDDALFDRVGSPDGSHENDFRRQKLNEVLASWGPLSLYDPQKARMEALDASLRAAGWTGSRTGLPTFLSQLDRHGYEVSKK